MDRPTMRRRAAGIATCLALCAGALLVAASPPAGASDDVSTASACDGRWRVVASPNPGSDRDLLRAVDTIGPDLAWAVGSTTELTGATRPLTVRWDGMSWQDVENGITTDAVLSGVEIIGPGDVWAVGYTAVGLTETRPLAIHWDGTRWTRTSVPRIHIANLTSVSGTASDDVWAVGMDRGFDPAMIVLHWDGTEWTRLPTPEVTTDFVALQDVIALSPTDAWAVGYTVDADFRSRPLAIHWDGTAWTRVRVPMTGTNGSALEDVTRTSTGELWVVGRRTEGTTDRPLALRLHEGRWASPSDPVGDAGRFEGVAPLPGGDLVAVGFLPTEDGTRALAQVWNGTTWEVTPTADPHGDDFLFDVTTVPEKAVSWAVGDQRGDEFPGTLIQRRCD
ncbi:MAG TPA: hypothetical protein VF640_06235 [Acidimicrobiales bacterium]